ncbi:D-alanyl-D-alanine carboxypeptidase family protein [Microbacterium fluvii]|uniref:D-alanyl-D-alanine carboxypeptidase family protein n=1 Tax=Microbacterium fluvii TaxID=415215 RepID=A0ABW2HAT9_9MICO|nr:D-alanyl-D-alanine carboxypeptidase [Microbacterium fluvii]MCU4672075.1 D-alanyl-D-alanine carboxypeptidase [Microbacterium fluvii]
MSAESHRSSELADLDELLRADAGDDDADAAHERPRGRRAGRIALAITAIVPLVLMAAAGGYVAWALNAPLPEPVSSFRTVEPPATDAVSLALPSGGASAISIAGGEDYLGDEADGIWASSGSNEPRSIASISKLITALVILDAHPLDGPDDAGPTITFSEADHRLYDQFYVRGATIAAMPAGSTMSLRDALATILIPSASNYAVAVSSWAYGSQWAFLQATREWLRGNGLDDTTIVEPTGLDARNTSTPADLIALGKLAAADPTIAQIVATPSLSLPGPGLMVNTNDLLGVAGVTGLKTGNLGTGRYSLLYTADLEISATETLKVTGVMLDRYSRAAVADDVTALLASIRSGFREVPVAARGEVVGSFSTPWGSTARAVVADDTAIFAWSDTPIAATMTTASPPAFADGEVVGTITWTAGPHTATADIVIDGDLEPPTDWWRLTHPEELTASTRAAEAAPLSP